MNGYGLLGGAPIAPQLMNAQIRALSAPAPMPRQNEMDYQKMGQALGMITNAFGQPQDGTQPVAGTDNQALMHNAMQTLMQPQAGALPAAGAQAGTQTFPFIPGLNNHLQQFIGVLR